MNYFRSTILAIAIFSVFLSGCPKSTEWKPTDPNLVAGAVNSLADHLNDPEKLQFLYAEGAVPDEATLSAIRQYMPKARANNVSASGDTATVDVMFEISSTGELLGPQQWTLVRVGEDWKLQDTPPPQ